MPTEYAYTLFENGEPIRWADGTPRLWGTVKAALEHKKKVNGTARFLMLQETIVGPRKVRITYLHERVK